MKFKFESVMMVSVFYYYVTRSSGQGCIKNPNINRTGDILIPGGLQIIVQNYNFSCNGRIIGITASIGIGGGVGSLPAFQVWRPLSSGPDVYSKVGQVQLENGTSVLGNFIYVSLDLSNNQIEFQSGDVIGCYHPLDLLHAIWWTSDANYTTYYLYDRIFTDVDIYVNITEYSIERGLPLISVIIDIRCDDLSAPANGEIQSCSSGRVGVGYEGDTCSFTCNTGYELTGGDTRTCQSDGSWSGTDNVCGRVLCTLLSNPYNGAIGCSLGDDGIPSYKDTCSFTCNTGYELTGSHTRSCQSDGSWNGTDNACERALCSSLNDPNNGTINCSLGNDGVPSYEDTCSFTCNTGYELTGSDTRICQSNRSWSGNNSMCRRAMHNDSGDSTDRIVIIGGTIGGIMLLLVITTVVLCIVMICLKKSCKRKASSINDQVSYSAKAATTIYDVIEVDNGTIKPKDVEGVSQYCNIPNENECHYAQPSQFTQHSNSTKPIKMDINPSYGINLGEAVKMEINPSYGISTTVGKASARNLDSKAQQIASTKQYDYAYTNVDQTKP